MSFDKDAARARRGQLFGPIEFLGQQVYVREESARVRDERDWRIGNGQLVEFRSFYVTRCVVDADGERLFEDADEEWLGELPADELQQVYDIATAGLAPEELERLKKKSVTLAAAPSGE